MIFLVMHLYAFVNIDKLVVFISKFNKGTCTGGNISRLRTGGSTSNPCFCTGVFISKFNLVLDLENEH